MIMPPMFHIIRTQLLVFLIFNMVLVSIIIPTYNSGKTIQTAIESVYTQDFIDWECIVVDGASTDDTIDIVKEYVEKDSRFRYISEPDKGIYDAFNKGWRMAKGEWIHYLGSDDRLVKNGISQLLAIPDLDAYGVISGHCYIEKIDGSIKPNYSKGFNGCHQGKLTRRVILEQLNGFDEQYPILADKDLMLRMERAGVTILNVDTFVAFFAMTGMSQSLKCLFRRSKELYKVYSNNNILYPFVNSCRYYLFSLASISYRKMKGAI